MNKLERHQKIIHYLQSKEEIEISEICEMFHVVPMTARRDLKELEAKGKLIRTHGGAKCLTTFANDTVLPFIHRTAIHTDEKKAIADAALAFVHNGQRIFLASGTTVHAFAQNLKNIGHLKIVTDAINIAYDLSSFPNISLICIGGEIRQKSLTATGKMAETHLNSFQLDSAFIGINGIDENGNIYLSSMAESSIVQNLCERVPNLYFLTDSSKIGKKDFIYIGTLQKGYTLITNKNAPEICIAQYQKRGAHVILA